MATFGWVTDITNGVMLNHALSKKLRFASIAKTKFVGFTRVEPGFGRKRGQSITIQRIRNIAVPTSAVIAEGQRIPVDQFLISTTSITPQQIARSVEYTDLVEQLNNYDVKNPIQFKLRQQMALVLDNLASDAFKEAKIKFIPTSLAGGTFDTDGTPSTQATANISIDHCGVIRDYLSDTIHTDAFEDDKYVGLGSTKLLRGIKNDPAFQVWRRYLQPGDVLYNSEVGAVESIRWIEVNNTAALSNAKGAASILGEGVVFGPDAVAMAEVVSPHLRVAIPGNYGLDKGVAWYGNLGFGPVWDTANDGEANIIHITSS